MEIKCVGLKCSDSSAVLSSCSISECCFNYSLIAPRRSHIDIHRKWEHKIMFVLGNSTAMETWRCNCSIYLICGLKCHSTLLRLNFFFMGLATKLLFICVLFSQSLSPFSYITTSGNPKFESFHHFKNVIRTFDSFLLSFVDTPLPAAIYLCLSSQVCLCSRLSAHSQLGIPLRFFCTRHLF